MLILALLACKEPEDTDVPSACDCAPGTDISLSPDEQGGFDDWTGAALGWAVDVVAGYTLVVGTEYELGIRQIPFEASCEDPSAVSSSWVPGVPPSAEDAAGRFPLLAQALSTPAGVRSIDGNFAAILVEGDPQGSRPEGVRVATGGEATLLRLEGIDQLQGSFTFGASAATIGGPAEVDCPGTIRVEAIDLEWASSGSP